MSSKRAGPSEKPWSLRIWRLGEENLRLGFGQLGFILSLLCSVSRNLSPTAKAGCSLQVRQMKLTAPPCAVQQDQVRSLYPPPSYPAADVRPALSNPILAGPGLGRGTGWSCLCCGKTPWLWGLTVASYCFWLFLVSELAWGWCSTVCVSCPGVVGACFPTPTPRTLPCIYLIFHSGLRALRNLGAM